MTSERRIFLLVTALAVFLFSHRSFGAEEERGSGGTIAFFIEVDANDSGVRIEVDGEFVGIAPTRVKVFGDRDGTFHRFQKPVYEIRAVPMLPGQVPQSKLFRTGGFFAAEDKIPTRVFFDMTGRSSPSLNGPGLPSARPRTPLRRSGSGFFVTDSGHLITAYHVVFAASNIQVKVSGKLLSATLIRRDQAADLAILKIETNSVGLPIAPSKNTKLGERVFTMGFPVTELLGEEPKFTEGSISSLAGFQDDWSAFQISVPIYSGNSGGALVNSEGSVIGVVVAKIRGSELVSYAVKSSRAIIVLEDLPDLALKPSQTANKLTPEAIAEALRRSSVMVIAE